MIAWPEEGERVDVRLAKVVEYKGKGAGEREREKVEKRRGTKVKEEKKKENLRRESPRTFIDLAI